MEKYVAYLDVLGYSEWIRKNDELKITEYFNHVKNWKKEVQSINDVSSLELFQFSDSIIIQSENTIKGLNDLLYTCQQIQIFFLKNEIYLRGIIVSGEIITDNQLSIISGKAILNAIELEKAVNYPGILIDTNILYKLNCTKHDFINTIAINNITKDKFLIDFNCLENSLYVNFARPLISEYCRNAKDLVLHKILQNLISNLYFNNYRYKKYNWVVRFFSQAALDYLSEPVPDYIDNKKREERVNYLFDKLKNL